MFPQRGDANGQLPMQVVVWQIKSAQDLETSGRPRTFPGTEIVRLPRPCQTTVARTGGVVGLEQMFPQQTGNSQCRL